MYRVIYYIFFFLIAFLFHINAKNKSVIIKWNHFPTQGTVSVKNGILRNLKINKGDGSIKKDNTFLFNGGEMAELLLEIDSAQLEFGPLTTIVTIETPKQGFSFFLRDVNIANPIYIIDKEVIISEWNDSRSYSNIVNDIQKKGLLTKTEQINLNPEASFESVSPYTRNMSCPIWLGLGQDIRLFEIEEEANDNNLEGKIIKPLIASTPIHKQEVANDELRYFYTFGKGVSTCPSITRSLENGYLPIYHSYLTDDDISYHSISFVTGEINDLSKYDASGSNYILFDHYYAERKLTDSQKQSIEAALKTDSLREGILLCINTTIKNNGKVPRYAWLMTPRPGNGWMKQYPYKYDSKNGISFFNNNSVFCISRINGEAIPNEEMAILLQPGEEVSCQYLLPHQPISMERGLAIVNHNFSSHYKAAQIYWQKQLQNTAQIHIPEKRIENMLKAGLFHLNMITYGNHHMDIYAPTIGIYHPIGTESAPIILYYLSMGWYEEAKRSLNYFLAWQYPDGSIQNYGGYMVETGAFLWVAGEYFRYTKDIDWVKKHKRQLLLSCEYLLKWRDLSKIDSLKKKGYGMVDGKFADVYAPYRQFSVNAYNYVGISRVAEMLETIDKDQSQHLKKEANEWKQDIWESIIQQLKITPVVPLGNGTWTSTISPWAEGEALRALYYKPEKFWSHGTFIDSDILSGPNYLAFCEIIDPNSLIGYNLLEYTRELFCQGLTVSSQPYYSRHNWMQLQRGEVKAFLNTYYNTMSALADRQIYSFWEHLYRCSPNKTHEEATFLMNTRWMLYLEKNDTLSIFKVIPRKWLEDGSEILLKGVGSYFGKLDIFAQSDLKNNCITAYIECKEKNRKPNHVIVRLPHPDGYTPNKVIGGIYNPKDESIIISNFTGKSEIKVLF